MHYKDHISTMEYVFNESVGLMADLHSSYNISNIFGVATKKTIIDVDRLIQSKRATVVDKITGIYQENFDDSPDKFINSDIINKCQICDHIIGIKYTVSHS